MPQNSYPRRPAPHDLHSASLQPTSGAESRRLQSSVSLDHMRRARIQEEVQDTSNEYKRERRSRAAASCDRKADRQSEISSALSEHELLSTSSNDRRKDALEIFEQYGISRPEGWLSEDDSSRGGSQQQARSDGLRMCHSCGQRISSRSQCSACGHNSCLKCMNKILDHEANFFHIPQSEQGRAAASHPARHAHRDVEVHDFGHLRATRVTETEFEHRQSTSSNAGGVTPKPPALTDTQFLGDRNEGHSGSKGKLSTVPPRDGNPWSIRKNPFLIADLAAKAQTVQPQAVVANSPAQRPARPPACDPRHRETVDQGRAAGHVDWPGYHHGGDRSDEHRASQRLVGSSLQREGREGMGTEFEGVNAQKPENRGNYRWSQDPLERKIKQLYRHAGDLHHSQHIMEHLAAGVGPGSYRSRTKNQHGTAGSRQIRPVQSQRLLRMHSLAKDDRSAFNQLKDLHELGVDAQNPSESSDEPLRMHSLVTDEFSELPRKIEPHNLLPDPASSRELSPKTHDLSQDVFANVAGWSIFRSADRLTSQGHDDVGSSAEQAGPSRDKGIEPSNEMRFKSLGSSAAQARLDQSANDPTMASKVSGIVTKSIPDLRWLRQTSKDIAGGRQDLARFEMPWGHQLKNVKSSSDRDAGTSTSQRGLTWRQRLKRDHAEHEVVAHRGDGCSGCRTRRSPSSAKEKVVSRQVMDDGPAHACEWRTRYMDLSSEVEHLRAEGESRRTEESKTDHLQSRHIDVGVGEALAQHDCDELAIQGLTIVMHMKGKDDLVINTDLSQEGSSCSHA